MPTIKFQEIKTYLSDRYDFRLNTIGLVLEYSKKGVNDWKTLNPANLECELFEYGFTGFDKQVSALLKSDFVKEYDPIKNYFNSLPEWDKENEPDYIQNLCGYVWADDEPFFRSQFPKALVRMVAQGLGALAFNKHCIVFHGKQNDGKSYFLRNLCPEPLRAYLKDNIDFEGTDSKRALAQNFVINLDELSGLSKTDVNRAKAMFAESQIKVRLPYDRNETIMPRRASFVASTNEGEFLVDSTGSVRWLVFKIHAIQHDNGGADGYGSVDINKVWAQALYMFRAGYNYNLTAKEIEYSEKNNQQYSKDTTEYELLISHFERGEKDTDVFYQSVDLLKAFQNLYGNAVRLSKEQIGKALQKMRIEKTQARKPGCTFPVYGYWLKQIAGLPTPEPAKVAEPEKPEKTPF